MHWPLSIGMTVTVFGSWLSPALALHCWSARTRQAVLYDNEMGLGKPTRLVLLGLMTVGDVLFRWLPHLPDLSVTTCSRCESLVAPEPLGPVPPPVPCAHPKFFASTGFAYCQDCGEELDLQPPRTQEEADRLLDGFRT